MLERDEGESESEARGRGKSKETIIMTRERYRVFSTISIVTFYFLRFHKKY